MIDNTFSAGHKIEDVRVETRKYQFLYNEGDIFHFMNTEDYNQIELQESILDQPKLMKEGEIVTDQEIRYSILRLMAKPLVLLK